MPELDAEHRNQIAEAVADAICRDRPRYSPDSACTAHQMQADYAADALAPLVAGWLADAWDGGYVAADHFTHRGVAHPCSLVGRPNPYRGGDDD